MFFEFHDFFEQPHAHARRLLTGVKPLPTDRDYLSDDVVRMAGLLIAAHAHDPSVFTLHEAVADTIRGIARDRGLSIGEVETTASDWHDLSEIYDVLQRLHTTPFGPAHLEELAVADQCLNDLPNTISKREVGLRDHLRFELSELRAQVLAALNLFEEALSAWRTALTFAQAADAHTPDTKYEYATLLRMVDWLAHEDANEALRAVLPVIAAREARTPTDANGLRLSTTLATFFARFGDRHEADIHIAHVERGLLALGCADLADYEMSTVLSRWAAVARRASRSHTERYDLFNQIIVSWVSVYAHRFGSPEGTQEDHRLMTTLAQMVTEMRAYQRETEAEDAAYLSETAPPSSRDILSPLTPLLTRFQQVIDAADSDAPSEAAQMALLEFASDETVPEVYRGRALIRLGCIAMNHGDSVEARRRFMAAGTLSRAGDYPDLTIEALKGVATVDFAEDQFAAAATIAGKAIRICEEMRSKVTEPYLSSAFMVDKFDLYVLGINAARRADDPNTMLARIEMLKSRAQKVRPGAISADVRAATLARLRDLKRAADPAEARRKRLAIWQEMMLSELPQPIPFDLAALQEQLGQDAVAITYFFFGQDVMLACLISGDDVLTERIALSEGSELFDNIEAVSGASNQTRGLEFVLQRIGKIVLPKKFIPALAAAERLVVCPHQALHAVPFSALPFQDGALLDNLEVVTVPNLTCLQIKVSHAPRNGLFAAATELAKGVKQPLPQAEPAARSAVEVWSNAGADAHLLLGEAAQYDRITDADTLAVLAKAKVVQFDFHGSDVSTSDLLQSPMESGVYLYDQHLDGLDISTFDLSADVVILLACHAAKRSISARGLTTLPADSVYGLQAALHNAGAQSMIGGLWEIDDLAAAKITPDLHRRLVAGETPSAALRGALLTYRDTAGPILDGVAFWGAFSLVAFGPGALDL